MVVIVLLLRILMILPFDHLTFIFNIVRLILESLAESFARTISNIGEIAHRNFREVIMIGGGSRINQLVGLTEHATGLSVQIKHQEATSIGNICVQAVSAGIFDSIDQARAATNTNGN